MVDTRILARAIIIIYFLREILFHVYLGLVKMVSFDKDYVVFWGTMEVF